MPTTKEFIMSVVARLPENTYELAKRIAALEGRQPGELIDEALQNYVQTNKDAFASNYEDAAKALRAGNLGALAGPRR